MTTITPYEALRCREYAIVKASDGSIYDLYRDEDTAKRIADDLNRRYGEASYYAAKVDFGEE
jgi:hypothetical protein